MDYPIKTLNQLRPILQGFRKSAGLTQAAMASHLGVTQQTYAQLEANPAAVSVERLFRVLRVLEIDLQLTQTATGQVASAGAPSAPSPAPSASPGAAPSVDEAASGRRRNKDARSVAGKTAGSATRKPPAPRNQAASDAKRPAARSPAKAAQAPASPAPRKTRGSAAANAPRGSVKSRKSAKSAAAANARGAGNKREDW